LLTVSTFLAASSAAIVSEQQTVAKANSPRLDEFGDPLPEGVFYRLGTTRLRHSKLLELKFSADGRRIYSRSRTTNMRVWDVDSGKAFQELPEGAFAVSPDDRYLAAKDSGTLLLFDKAIGKELARWRVVDYWYGGVFSSDSKTLILWNTSNVIRRWDVVSLKELSPQPLLKEPSPQPFLNVPLSFGNWSLSPGGALVAGMTGHSIVHDQISTWRFWDTSTGKECRPPLETGPIFGLNLQCCWSADSKLFAVAGCDAVEVWNTVAGKRVWRHERRGGQTPMVSAFHPNSRDLALGFDGSVALWNLKTGKQTWAVEIAANEKVEVLTFSKDGRRIGAGSSDAIVLLESVAGARIGFSKVDPGGFAKDPSGFESRLRAVHFADNNRVFLVKHGAGISVRETASGKEIRSLDGNFVHAVSPDGISAVLESGNKNGVRDLRLLNITTGKEVWRMVSAGVWGVVFAADGKTLAVLRCEKGALDLLDAATGRELGHVHTELGLDKFVIFAVTSDLKMAASANFNGSIQLWDLTTGAKLAALQCPPDWEWYIPQFLPNDRRIIGVDCKVTMSFGGPQIPKAPPSGEMTCVWDAVSGKKLQSRNDLNRYISPDGTWMAFTKDRYSQSVDLRNAKTGQLHATLPCSELYGFSPTGNCFVAGKNSHSIQLWETATGQLLREWSDSSLDFNGATFSADGRTLAITTTDGTVLICDVTNLASKPGTLPKLRLNVAEIERMWSDLAGAGGPQSQRAFWKFAAGGDQAVKALKKRLQPVKRPDPMVVAALLADLDDQRHAVREKASHALQQMELARPAMEAAFASNPSPEARQRLKHILAKMTEGPWDAELLRAWRSVLVLEQIGTPEARQLIASLAKGAPAARLTIEAQASLERVAKRQR